MSGRYNEYEEVYLFKSVEGLRSYNDYNLEKNTWVWFMETGVAVFFFLNYNHFYWFHDDCNMLCVFLQKWYISMALQASFSEVINVATKWKDFILCYAFYIIVLT